MMFFYSHLYIVLIFTVRNEVAKDMFLQACVCPHGGGSASVHAGIPHPPEKTPPREQTHPPEADPPGNRHPPRSRHPHPQSRHTPQSRPPQGAHTPGSRHPPGADTPLRDGHCCGRYASYWNAFLLVLKMRLRCCWSLLFRPVLRKCNNNRRNDSLLSTSIGSPSHRQVWIDCKR